MKNVLSIVTIINMKTPTLLSEAEHVEQAYKNFDFSNFVVNASTVNILIHLLELLENNVFEFDRINYINRKIRKWH